MLVYQRVSPESTLNHTNTPLTKPHRRDAPHASTHQSSLRRAMNLRSSSMSSRTRAIRTASQRWSVGQKKKVLSVVIEDAYDSYDSSDSGLILASGPSTGTSDFLICWVLSLLCPASCWNRSATAFFPSRVGASSPCGRGWCRW